MTLLPRLGKYTFCLGWRGGVFGQKWEKMSWRNKSYSLSPSSKKMGKNVTQPHFKKEKTCERKKKEKGMKSIAHFSWPGQSNSTILTLEGNDCEYWTAHRCFQCWSPDFNFLFFLPQTQTYSHSHSTSLFI